MSGDDLEARRTQQTGELGPPLARQERERLAGGAGREADQLQTGLDRGGQQARER